MLQKNPLSPPRPPRTGPSAVDRPATAGRVTPFVSAEDFDATGILAGVDPCESRYWWMPELAAADQHGPQATRRSALDIAADA